MARILLTVMALLTLTVVSAQQETHEATIATDTTATASEPPRKLSLIRRIIRGFDQLDERYIEPQHYVFTVMMQATQNLDIYTMSSGGNDRQTVTFKENNNLRVGPYFGWKWFFAGYTFDIRNIGFSKGKKGLDLSVYSSQVGVDIWFSRTSSEYELRDAKLGSGIDGAALEGVQFGGLKSVISGLNLYYIFNHGRFSYPAAFSQSTRQKLSCGSWLAGFGYTRNTLEFDYHELQRVVDERLSPGTVQLDSGLMFNSIRYADYNLSAGYAYNWVFAPRWLFCAGAQAALAYKTTIGNTHVDGEHRGFDFDNVNLNAIGRVAVVFNNDRWYAGFSSIVRMNNYRKQRFHASNVFGSLNLYAGYNFGLKKKYKKKQ